MEHAKKKRYYILDTIRGITLISMIAFHAVWDLVYIFGVDWDWYKAPGAYIWQQSICWVFIALSGFCWSLGRRKLRRGLTVLLAGFLVSLVTEIAMPEQRVRFGVLTLLGFSMLAMIPLDMLWKKAFHKLPAAAGFLGSLLAFVITRNVNDGYLGFEGLNLVKLPAVLYKLGDGGNFLGFTERSFYSTDYFSVLPWFFLFLAGYFAYYVAKEKKVLEKAAALGPLPKSLSFIDFCGRHSLIIYMLHQPIIYGVLFLIFQG